MTAREAFGREQRSVLISMIGALVVAILALSAAAWMGRGETVAPLVDRLRFALRAELLVVGWLAAAIANVARLRFFSRQDIAGSSAAGGSAKVRQAGAILQNTLEQVVLALAAHLIVAATFSRPQALLLALVSLFALGRLLFWVGYKRGARGRAFGFALTFYPSVLGLLASAASIAFSANA